MSVLLPCPFCGEEPYVAEPAFQGADYQIGCDSEVCGGEDRDGEGAVWRDGKTFEEAAERWNRRFSPPDSLSPGPRTETQE